MLELQLDLSGERRPVRGQGNNGLLAGASRPLHMWDNEQGSPTCNLGPPTTELSVGRRRGSSRTDLTGLGTLAYNAGRRSLLVVWTIRRTRNHATVRQ